MYYHESASLCLISVTCGLLEFASERRSSCSPTRFDPEDLQVMTFNTQPPFFQALSPPSPNSRPLESTPLPVTRCDLDFGKGLTHEVRNLVPSSNQRSYADGVPQPRRLSRVDCVFTPCQLSPNRHPSSSPRCSLHLVPPHRRLTSQHHQTQTLVSYTPSLKTHLRYTKVLLFPARAGLCPYVQLRSSLRVIFVPPSHPYIVHPSRA